jgi:hypothetical protein
MAERYETSFCRMLKVLCPIVSGRDVARDGRIMARSGPVEIQDIMFLHYHWLLYLVDMRNILQTSVRLLYQCSCVLFSNQDSSMVGLAIR